MSTPRFFSRTAGIRSAVVALVGLFGAIASPAFALDDIGIQLWSMRETAKVDVDKALTMVEGWKFKEVETASTYGLSAEAFAEKLKQHHLKAVSAHYGYDRLNSDLPGIIAEAKALGVKAVVCPILPHKDRKFDEAYAHEVAQKFNQIGKALKAAGIQFGYHTHGFEFTPLGNGSKATAFDILVKETDSKLVTFEMDVFWVFITGTDPLQLLERYPDRWSMVHLKDLKKGVALTNSTGGTGANDDVAVGEGQIPWPALLAQFKKVGVKHYFIEDETTDPIQNIPVSLKYLKQLGK